MRYQTVMQLDFIHPCLTNLGLGPGSLYNDDTGRPCIDYVGDARIVTVRRVDNLQYQLIGPDEAFDRDRIGALALREIPEYLRLRFAAGSETKDVVRTASRLKFGRYFEGDGQVDSEFELIFPLGDLGDPDDLLTKLPLGPVDPSVLEYSFKNELPEGLTEIRVG